ncbi:hypothetical protein TNCV_2537081 [Trichonephila clavipes]|nr:hypothetical protein TNCV_2537081 [Trichonephila clavipes]
MSRGVATAVSMIQGPQATRVPTCVTRVPLTGFSYLKKGPEGFLTKGPLRTSYASVYEAKLPPPQSSLFFLHGDLAPQFLPPTPITRRAVKQRQLLMEIELRAVLYFEDFYVFGLVDHFSWNSGTISFNRSPGDDTIPMHMSTPKYCRALPSDIVPATYDREKTQRLVICEPEAPSVIRGARKNRPHPMTMEWEREIK